MIENISFDGLIHAVMELSLILKLVILSLGLLAIKQLRQRHIGRIGIAVMALLILQQAIPVWGRLEPIWKIYTLGGVVFGGVAVPSYLAGTSLPTEFYKIAYILYGAIPVILILVFGFPI